jgi:hypothetical protein
MFRFTIRELLLVTVIAAVAVAWWIDRKRIADIADQRDLWTFRAESAREVIRRGGDQFTWEGDEILWTHTDAAGRQFNRMMARNPSPAPGVVATPPTAGLPVLAAPARVTRKSAPPAR